MSERFVRGWKVSLPKLQGLVGAKRLKASEILNSKANAKCRSDVLMTLGEGDEKDGAKIADRSLSALLAGKLDRKQAYEYARVMELLLNHVAQPLATKYVAKWREPQDQIALQWTYYAPTDSFGCWNPLLKRLELPKLAKAWAAPNVHFPWKPSKKAPAVDWPLWTYFDSKELDVLAKELSKLTRAGLKELPAKILVDEAKYAEQCRDELWTGLERLRDWIERARAPEKREGLAYDKQKNGLMLLMDGDQ